MGLLLCQDVSRPETKAKTVLDLIENGRSGHNSYISSKDKDWKSFFHKLFSMATVMAIEGAEVGKLYSEIDLNSLKDAFEEVGD